MKFQLLAGLFVLAFSSARGAQEWHTLSGKIDLLPGYVDHLKPNAICYDSNCGEIWKPGGLDIDYELNNGAYELEDQVMPVYCQDNVNGQTVELALDFEPDDMSRTLLMSFPNEAIFNAKVRSQQDIRTMINMLLTYRGKNYDKAKADDDAAVICGGLRDVFGNPFGNTQVHLKHLVSGRQWMAETNTAGRFKIAGLPAGRYILQTDAFTDDADCKYPIRTWHIDLRHGEKMIFYRVLISASKDSMCRDSG